MKRGIFGTSGTGEVTRIYPPNMPYLPSARSAKTGPPTSGHLALPGLGPAAADGFRFTWHTTREGAACWVQIGGAWRAGVIVHRGRATVTVAATDRVGRQRYVKRGYQDLRRRMVRPALRAIAGGRSGAWRESDGRSEAR